MDQLLHLVREKPIYVVDIEGGTDDAADLGNHFCLFSRLAKVFLGLDAVCDIPGVDHYPRRFRTLGELGADSLNDHHMPVLVAKTEGTRVSHRVCVRV